MLSRTYTLLITVHTEDPPTARELAGAFQLTLLDSKQFERVLVHGWEGNVTHAPPEIKDEHQRLLQEVRQ